MGKTLSGPRRPDSVGKLQNADGIPTYLEAIACRQQQQAGWLFVEMVARERKLSPKGPARGCADRRGGSESRFVVCRIISFIAFG